MNTQKQSVFRSPGTIFERVLATPWECQVYVAKMESSIYYKGFILPNVNSLDEQTGAVFFDTAVCAENFNLEDVLHLIQYWRMKEIHPSELFLNWKEHSLWETRVFEQKLLEAAMREKTPVANTKEEK